MTPTHQLRQDDVSNNQEKRLDAWLALTGQIAAPAGPVDLPLLTGSMVPAIPVGATLRIAAATGADCQPGDVAVFLAEERLLAHRVLLVLQAGPWHWLLEKGDANALGQWRRADTVRGRVLGFAIADESVHGDPADPALASGSLRRHLIHYCKTLGGLRATKPKA
jgi:hypothetical protein